MLLFYANFCAPCRLNGPLVTSKRNETKQNVKHPILSGQSLNPEATSV